MWKTINETTALIFDTNQRAGRQQSFGKSLPLNDDNVQRSGLRVTLYSAVSGWLEGVRSQQQDRMYLDNGNKHSCRRRRFEFYCGRHYPTCAVVKFGFNFFTRWCTFYPLPRYKKSDCCGSFYCSFHEIWWFVRRGRNFVVSVLEVISAQKNLIP